MPRLNNEERARCLGMLECDISQENVARRFNVSRSTIVRLVSRVNTTGSLSDRLRSGAPRVTSVRQDVYIRQRHLRDRFITAQATFSAVICNRGQTVSRNTVRNRLRERGIFCRRPQRGVVLTERHRR
jgi:transposase